MSIRCEDILGALATGGPIRRWRAKRHAARCARCAKTQSVLRLLAEALVEASPLTEAHTRLWRAASEVETAIEPTRAWWSRPALAGAIATLILGAVGGWWALRPVEFRPAPPSLTTVNPPAVREETLSDLAGLRKSVVALTQELDELRRMADLLDVRKDADSLMARIVPRSGSSDF